MINDGNSRIQPDISVIVPVFNAEKTIGKCLESLVNQSVKQGRYEVIVVDDGSADRTGEIIKKFPVSYIRQDNQGPAVARNRGVAAASGEILLFTDADCIPLHNWIEKMLEPFQNQEVAAVKGVYRTGQLSMVARLAQVEFEERYQLLRKVEHIDMVDTYSAGYRSEIFKALSGGFDTSFPVANNEDTEFSYRMSRAGYKMVFQPEAVVCHLNHPETLKKYLKLKFRRGYWRMVVYKKYPGKMFADTYTPKELKIQVLVALMLPVTVILSVFIRPFLWFTYLLLAVYLFTTIPFLRVCLVYDRKMTAVVPLFLLLRSLVIGAGSICGVVKQPRRCRFVFLQ